MNDFRFKKKFGQNFLSDVNLLDAIVADAGIGGENQVLEIGPGAGALTKSLAKVADKVVAVEIDEELKPFLSIVCAENKNVQVIFGDFMKQKKQDIEKHFTKKYDVVANLPYYITTPIIFKILEENYNVGSLTLMVQKEVAERFVADETSKEYGAVSVMLQSQADLKITRVVPRTMFHPQPNVDSAVIHIKLNDKKFDIPHKDEFAKVVKSAFAWRRKTLLNCLEMGLNVTKERAQKIIEKAGLPANIRGEKLNIANFIALSNIVAE